MRFQKLFSFWNCISSWNASVEMACLLVIQIDIQAVCLSMANKICSFVFWENLWRANLLLVLSDLQHEGPCHRSPKSLSSLKSYKGKGQTNLQYALFLPFTEATLIQCCKSYLNDIAFRSYCLVVLGLGFNFLFKFL